MTFLCEATGVNPHYGKDGEVRPRGDYFTRIGLKEGWLRSAKSIGKHPFSNILMVTPIDDDGHKIGNTRAIK